ncbi:hypothetical protein LCGC14_2326000 [marine sediment metagenome]|uniref:Uncharacterized protein n=1 Tax=marine sediment metagenome TaxID=412755 RepID=A0A0F9CGF3_9ZZZZ
MERGKQWLAVSGSDSAVNWSRDAAFPGTVFNVNRGPKFFIVQKHNTAHRQREYWTGEAWTVVSYFAKEYDFGDALDIVEHRFHKMHKQPKIMRCDLFNHSVRMRDNK